MYTGMKRTEGLDREQEQQPLYQSTFSRRRRVSSHCFEVGVRGLPPVLGDASC